MYHQAQTGFSLPFGLTFDGAVQAIIKHRLENRAVQIRHQLALDPETVGKELEAFTAKRLGLPDPALPKSQPGRSIAQFASASAVGLVRVAQGAAPTLEWLGSGREAVKPEVANLRAETCVGCPMNDTEKQLVDWFTIPTSNMIKKALELRTDLKLSTRFDDHLGVCRACYCPLKLKAWTPGDIILKYLKPEVRAELEKGKNCWILAEEKTPPKNP
jgi:hypothetical protein